MIPLKNILYINILFIIFSFCFQKDISTFSNYEQIKQTNLEINFNIDFNSKTVHGIIKAYFTALDDGEVIVLDTKALKINSIIDSDTGDELEFVLDSQYELDSLGIPLKIYKEYSKGETIAIVIKYSTTEEGASVQWLSPEQTSGKKYPYMFTQGFSILNRELFPSQDTPAVKCPVIVGITVEKPLYAVESGIYKSQIDNGNTITYFCEQEVPIPSYLVAMAAGAIEQRVISDRIKVYAEAEIVDQAAEEFEDTEKFLQQAESYIFPYQWKEYNILVMPISFPYGGMENPTLTFVSPMVITGDKSEISTIIHELCH
jgi:leukotriene-A4 hydrolase